MNALSPLNLAASRGLAALENLASADKYSPVNVQGVAGSPASSIVSIPSGNDDPTLQTYSPHGLLTSGLPPVVWTSDTSDSISALMKDDYTSSTMGGRFAGLGSALLDRFETTGDDYSQSVSYGPATGAGAYGSLSQLPQGKIDLTVKTKSGATVDIEIDSENGGLSVNVKSSSKLSDSERGAVAKLADGFQKAIDGLSAQPPTVDLSGLTQFDTSAIASVSFKYSLSNDIGSNISASYTQDSASRDLSVQTADGTVNLKVDTSNPALWGASKQRDAAVASLLKQFDAANSRGHGNAALMSMFEDGFTQMNADYGPGGAPSALPGGENSSSLMTGLADYSASIHNNSATNPANPDETDTFDYHASQNTTLNDTSTTTGLTQQQQSQLDASFHQTMTGAGPQATTSSQGMTAQTLSQNYDFMKIDDSAESTVQLTAERGALVSATLDQSVHQKTRDAKHQHGVLISDVTTPNDTSSKKNLLLLLKPLIASGAAKHDTPAWELAKTLANAMIQLKAHE